MSGMPEMPEMPGRCVASFDLGIKNLSYCVTQNDSSGNLTAIYRWVNMNLLADGAASQSQTRCACGGPASWSNAISESETVLLCKKCAKKSAKPGLELTDTKLAGWRTWAETAFGIPEKDAKKLSKNTIQARAATIRLMPYKAPKAKGVTLQALLAAMEICLNTELSHLVRADVIRIENQPSEFAPHMKSVQIMLFTLLDHRLRVEKGWNGSIEFANASVKTRGTDAATGKDGKRSRKLAGIAKATEILQTSLAKYPVISEYLLWWQSQSKKDDLADALLMCVVAV
jgi:hypothetical protein